MCGKTGTAQNTHGLPNSVFVAFAPRDHPRIAIAVVVENSGEGAHWAAPIASFIVEKYLRGSVSQRESGITPEYFMDANKLPDIIPKIKKTVPAAIPSNLKKDSVNKANKIKVLKSASGKNKKDQYTRVFAALPMNKDDE